MKLGLVNNMKRLIRKNKFIKTANYISTNFDYFVLDSGDIIAIGCRLVNNKPWYQVYQEGQYNTSSYYDGDNYDKAVRVYKDLLTAFKGVSRSESFLRSEVKIKEQINDLIKEKEMDDYNFQRLKSNPLFLGVNDF